MEVFDDISITEEDQVDEGIVCYHYIESIEMWLLLFGDDVSESHFGGFFTRKRSTSLDGEGEVCIALCLCYGKWQICNSYRHISHPEL